jgi:hypothetical protein
MGSKRKDGESLAVSQVCRRRKPPFFNVDGKTVDPLSPGDQMQAQERKNWVQTL